MPERFAAYACKLRAGVPRTLRVERHRFVLAAMRSNEFPKAPQQLSRPVAAWRRGRKREIRQSSDVHK